MKLPDIIKIYEVGDTRAELINWQQEGEKYIGTFFEKGIQYEIHLVRFNTSTVSDILFRNKLVYNVQFCYYKNGKQDIKLSKEKNAVRVMSIIQNEAVNKISQLRNRPDLISFTVSTDPEHNTKEEVEARIRLYTRIAMSLAPKLNYPFVYSPILAKRSKNVIISDFEIVGSDMDSLKRMLMNKL